jgi:hypothetical protein
VNCREPAVVFGWAQVAVLRRRDQPIITTPCALRSSSARELIHKFPRTGTSRVLGEAPVEILQQRSCHGSVAAITRELRELDDVAAHTRPESRVGP